MSSKTCPFLFFVPVFLCAIVAASYRPQAPARKGPAIKAQQSAVVVYVEHDDTPDYILERFYRLPAKPGSPEWVKGASEATGMTEAQVMAGWKAGVRYGRRLDREGK